MNWDSVVSFLFGESNLIFSHAATACDKIWIFFIHIHYSYYIENKQQNNNDTCFFKKKGKDLFVCFFWSAGQYNGGSQLITTFPTGLPLGIALYKILFLWPYRNRT